MRDFCLPLAVLLSIGCFNILSADDDASVSEEKQKEKPLQVMIVTGGCCHDYEFQTKMLMTTAEERGMAIEWTVVNKGGKGTKAQIEMYNDADWAKGIDVVIHNECFANTTDPDYIEKITKAHKAGVNAVVIHCAMHTYRAAKMDEWRKLLGVTSRRHDHQSEYPVKVVDKTHPVMAGFPEQYVTKKDELYIIEHVWPEVKVLATSVSEKSGESHPVFWTNKYGKARVFGTTYGHSNETFADKTFLETVLRGTLWAAGRLPAAEKAVAIAN